MQNVLKGCSSTILTLFLELCCPGQMPSPSRGRSDPELESPGRSLPCYSFSDVGNDDPYAYLVVNGSLTFLEPS